MSKSPLEAKQKCFSFNKVPKFYLGYLKAPPRVVVGGPSLKMSPDMALTPATCGEVEYY